MIDLHCHLLPGIDDGPPDADAMLALARAQVDAGVATVVATPHVAPSMPNRAADIARAVDEARRMLVAADLPLEVATGAEIDLALAAELPDDELRALALGGGPWLLVEAPLRAARHVDRAVRALQARGFAIVLAHPERSPSFQREPELLRGLVADGVLTQITAGSVCGDFGRVVGSFTDWMVDEGLVHVVASDAHDAAHRAPGLRAALARGPLRDRAPWLVESVPGAILDGQPIPDLPAPSRRGNLLRRIRHR